MGWPACCGVNGHGTIGVRARNLLLRSGLNQGRSDLEREPVFDWFQLRLQLRQFGPAQYGLGSDRPIDVNRRGRLSSHVRARYLPPARVLRVAIRRALGGDPLRNFKIDNAGWTNLMVEVDGRWLFRFPRWPGPAREAGFEVRLLEYLSRISRLPFRSRSSWDRWTILGGGPSWRTGSFVGFHSAIYRR